VPCLAKALPYLQRKDISIWRVSKGMGRQFRPEIALWI
jgi:hypothetical protein